jgi:hypothetical protein
VSETDDTAKSGTVASGAEGGRWRVEVEDDKKNWIGGSNARLG